MATVPQVKKSINIVCEAFGLSYDDGLNICASYKGGPEIGRILSGDLSDVPAAAASLGITLQGHTGPETVAGDVLPASDFAGLPADLEQRIDDIITEFCGKYHLDDITKASADQWRAVCMLCGRRIFKGTDILRDKRPRGYGSPVPYDGEKVNALVDLWAYMCAASKHAPLICDFVAFSGVSDAWLYGQNGRSVLTSSRSGVLEKLRDLQECGVASRLVDGRVNPTGSIFFLKNCHGWRDQREVVNIKQDATAGPVSLPVFDVSGGGFSASLPDSSGPEGLPG